MKIVLMFGFNSSAYFQPPRDDYMGGRDGLREEIEAADVVMAYWSPEHRPIVLKCPEGVEIAGAYWGFERSEDPKEYGGYVGRMVGTVTAQEMHDDIQGRGAGARAVRKARES